MLTVMIVVFAGGKDANALWEYARMRGWDEHDDITATSQIEELLRAETSPSRRPPFPISLWCRHGKIYVAICEVETENPDLARAYDGDSKRGYYPKQSGTRRNQ